jgi:Flp pilus assembly pilin Flp
MARDTGRGRAAEEGQGLVEYVLILMLVAILLILSVAILGHQTSDLYSNVANDLQQ